MTDAERVARFWMKVEKGGTGACWVWTASRTPDGYGRFRAAPGDGPGTKVSAHRFAYELANGPIPDGLQLDHLCRNRACVNPAHLEAVTGQVNTLRGQTIPAAHAAKTECLNGHPLTGSNLFVSGDGERVCRICRRERQNRSLGVLDPEERKRRQREAQRRCRSRS